MKKKQIIFIAVLLVLVIPYTLYVTNLFTKSNFTDRLYQEENVYEEIWNLVALEKHGTKTVLTTSTERAYVDVDLGAFNGILIPQYDISLDLREDELWIFVFEDTYETTGDFVYDYKTNTLYGNYEESYLYERFLSHYDSWMGESGKFPAENRGSYTYVYEEYPLSHDD